MKKLLVICAALCMAATAADAKPKHHEKEKGRECKDAIKASGDAALRLSKAENNAWKSWQEIVINNHGEQYMNKEYAKVQDRHCDPARVGGGMGPLSLKRCVILARPCKG
jgi:hypothetical protein